MKIYNPTGFSSSLTGSFSGSVKGTFEGSFTGQSLNNISGAFDSVSSSLAQNITINASSISNINAATSSYLLNTTDTLDGNLTVTGTITAQEFHTEFVSASIIYESGSTQFGNTNDDRHTFTGRVGIGTSSPVVNLHVEDTSSFSLVRLVSSNASVSGVDFGDSDDDDIGRVRYDHSADVMLFHTNADERMRIDSSGNVGINVTPSQRLDVNGTALIRNTVYVGDNIQHWGDGGTGLYFDTDTLSLQNDGGTTRLHIQSGGNVGIGTTNPDVKFQVQGGPVKAATSDYAAPSTGGAISMFQDSNNYGTIWSVKDYNGAWGNIAIAPLGGYVGIGTTLPNYHLEVNGAAQIEDYIRITNTGGAQRLIFGNQDSVGVDNPSMIVAANGSTHIGGGNSWSGNGGTIDYTATFTDGGSVGIGTTSPIKKLTVYGGNDNGIWVDSQGAQYSSIALGNNGSEKANLSWDNTNARASLTAYGSTGTTQLVANNKIGLRVESDGKVRINPDSLSLSGGALKVYYDMQLYNTISFTDSSFNTQSAISGGGGELNLYSNGTSNLAIKIKSGGYVGINSTNPASQLDINATGAHGLVLSRDLADNANSSRIFFLSSDGNIGLFANQGRLDFRTGSTPGSTSGNRKMTLTQAGDLLIGTGTSPNAKLELNVASGDGLLIKSADVSTIKMKGSGGVTDWGFAATNLAAGDFGIYASNSAGGDPITAGAPKMYFTSGGNVGIGTTSPSAKLAVSGDTYVSGEFGQGVAIADKLVNYGAEFRSNSASAQIFFGRSGNSVGTGAIGADSTSTFIVWDSSFNKRLTILQNGNVGIGTATPLQPLHVYKESAGFGTSAMRMYINRTGTNVGSIIFTSGTPTVSNGWAEIGQTDADGDLYFKANPTAASYETRMVIKGSTGDVGIGTTAPSGRLHVESSTTSNSGMTNHNGVYTHSVSGTKPGSTVVKLRVFPGNYSTGLLNFSYAHTNSGSSMGHILVYVNNSYGTIYTNTISDKLSFTHGTLSVSTYSPGGGAGGAFYEITMPSANGSPGYWAATITGAGNFYFNVV